MPYVQAINGALASALASGAVNQRADAAHLLPDGTARVSSIGALTASRASVAFSITDSSSDGYVDRFVGSAVDSNDRWKLAWVTVCMLVEQEGVICPNPPTGLFTPLPLPYSINARTQSAAEAPDLLRPQSLAMTSGGDVLIADTDRDQILEWEPPGELRVYAGTGQPGFSGDGGPAVDARLENLGGMAMSLDGTLYFVDADRVRAISPSGIITTVAGDGKSAPLAVPGPALQASLNPYDVAVATGGTLYIASNCQILKVSSSGFISTFITGGPPYGVDVRTQRGVTAFFPTAIAFDGAGNLDVFSSSPKELFQISPSGKIKDLGGSYATQLVEAPDGDVLVAGHGGTISRVTPSGVVTNGFDLLSMKIAGYGIKGERGGFQPDGIAVARSGAIFVDTFSGNGYTVSTSFAEIEPNGSAQELPIGTPVLAKLPGPRAPGFPSLIYPSATPATGVDLSSCPNPAGLRPFDTSAVATARAVAPQFNAFSSSFYADLRSSDRSWWTGLFKAWSGDGYDLDTHAVVSVGPASRDTFAAAVSHACGERLVRDSLVIDVGVTAQVICSS